MIFLVLRLAADLALLPMRRFIMLQFKLMLNGSRKSAYAAIRVAIIVEDVRRSVLLLITAGTGMPMTIRIGRPRRGPVVRMTQCRGNDISAGRTGLRRRFRRGSARRMSGRIFPVSADGTDVVMVRRILLPIRTVRMVRCFFFAADGAGAGMGVGILL